MTCSCVQLFCCCSLCYCRFREYKIIMVQLIYVPFCFVILARGFIVEFFLLKFMLFLLPLVRNLCINYVFWRHQPELQVDLRTVLLSPFYNFFLICCAIHGRYAISFSISGF